MPDTMSRFSPAISITRQRRREPWFVIAVSRITIREPRTTNHEPRTTNHALRSDSFLLALTSTTYPLHASFPIASSPRTGLPVRRKWRRSPTLSSPRCRRSDCLCSLRLMPIPLVRSSWSISWTTGRERSTVCCRADCAGWVRCCFPAPAATSAIFTPMPISLLASPIVMPISRCPLVRSVISASTTA